ncbi:unnamed protein product, partial [Vitis vinifera]
MGSIDATKDQSKIRNRRPRAECRYPPRVRINVSFEDLHTCKKVGPANPYPWCRGGASFTTQRFEDWDAGQELGREEKRVAEASSVLCRRCRRADSDADGLTTDTLQESDWGPFSSEILQEQGRLLPNPRLRHLLQQRAAAAKDVHFFGESYAEQREPYLKKAGNGRYSWRRPFITHFTGCQPCSGKHNQMYAGESCWNSMQKALNFADNQVLRNFGFVHPDLLDSSTYYYYHTDAAGCSSFSILQSFLFIFYLCGSFAFGASPIFHD